MKALTLFFLGLLAAAHCSAQQSTLDIVAIHQLVDESISEHTLQVNAKNRQAANTAAEQANETLTGKWKSLDRTLQQRYNTLGTLIGAADIAVYAAPVLSTITDCQRQIMALAAASPQMIPIAAQSQAEFVSEAEALLGYLTGLSLSLGELNQMRASDRKLLFDYALTELTALNGLCLKVLHIMQGASLSSALGNRGTLGSFVSQDKAIAGRLITGAKYLK